MRFKQFARILRPEQDSSTPFRRTTCGGPAPGSGPIHKDHASRAASLRPRGLVPDRTPDGRGQLGGDLRTSSRSAPPEATGARPEAAKAGGEGAGPWLVLRPPLPSPGMRKEARRAAAPRGRRCAAKAGLDHASAPARAAAWPWRETAGQRTACLEPRRGMSRRTVVRLRTFRPGTPHSAAGVPASPFPRGFAAVERDDSPAQGPADELGLAPQAELGQHAAAVRLGRADADPEPLGDGGVAQPLCGQVQDLALPEREPLVGVVSGLDRGAAPECRPPPPGRTAADSGSAGRSPIRGWRGSARPPRRP